LDAARFLASRITRMLAEALEIFRAPATWSRSWSAGESAGAFAAGAAAGALAGAGAA
jgi:hypothetical protein